uniref:SHC-transforming protein 3 n=1 Tax=Aceria tosichella TaxID=561515 RepID=A0A6G1SB09_9ACAR
MHNEVVIHYIGCIGVKTSMRSLDPKTRAKVAKESISRLCKANNIDRKIDEKPQQDHINQMLDDQPNLLHSGTRVELSITTTHLNVISKETKETIVQHEMPNVSFASSGDNETVDFVAYVAKNPEVKRACYVLECSAGSGKNVLDEIARGFELRTQQIRTQYNSNTLSKKSPTLSHDSFNSAMTNVFHAADFNDITLDSSYRNNNENNHHNDSFVAETRASLQNEKWFHGSYLSREESETRLKQDGDFLVRESMLDPGHFVLSVMNEGTKLHLLFDTIGKVRTKEMEFNNISQLISFHHEQCTPIVAEGRIVYLRNGVPPPRLSKQTL